MMTVTEVARAKRSWPAEYKLQILAEIDNASVRGEVGEICRREGLYASLIDSWRRQRDTGAMEGLRDRKTGPKAAEAPRAELARLRAKIARLEDKLATAEELVAAQGKVSALLHDLSAKSATQNETKRCLFQGIENDSEFRCRFSEELRDQPIKPDREKW